MKSDVAIIGAGPGGLAAAMLLGHAGLKVTLLERQSVVGGRTSPIEANGYRFDTGPTFFLYPRVLEEIYAQVGRNLFEEVKMTRLDPLYRLVFGAGGQLDATSDLPRMEREIAKISPTDAGAFQKYIDNNRVKLKKFRPILEKPFSGVLDYLDPQVIASAMHLRPWRSLGQELESYFSDPRMVIAFSFQSKYLGMSPFKCPSLFSILAFLEYEHGVWHPEGGCSAVTANMAEVCRDLGVEILLDEEVQSLEFEGKRPTSLTTNNRNLEFDQLVINADFARAMENLVPDHIRDKWNNETLEKKKYSCSTFMMYLGIEGSFPDVAHHTIYIAKDYQKNLREIEDLRVLSEDPSIYVQNASITDKSLAPQGHSTLYVLAPVTHMTENVDWETQTESFRQRCLTQLEKIGVTNLRDRIRFEKIITPQDWDHGYQLYKGATFNLAHNLGQMLHRRPHNRFEDLDSVFLVGGGTHPGSGLPVIFESARISAKLMMKDRKRKRMAAVR